MKSKKINLNMDRFEDNEWIRPRKNNYKMMCCDCGLVHEFDFGIVFDKKDNPYIVYRVRRDDYSTIKYRHKNKIKISKGKYGKSLF
jgi:hypothetical protein